MLKIFIKEWLLPLWIYDIVYYWIIGTILGNCGQTISRYRKSCRKIFVLANGPSLKNDIERYGDEIVKTDALVVNQFCQSEYFVKIKPRIYLLVDPKYFAKEDEIEEGWKPRVRAVKESLASKVDWEMYLVVPFAERMSDVVKIAQGNPSIKVLLYNSRPSRSECDLLGLLARNLIAPPSASVINVAVYLGVYWRYDEVVLIGADTSSHRMMVVDQLTNEMFLEEEHFYGTVRRPFYMNDAGSVRATAADWLDMTVRVFRGYEKVGRLAKFLGVKVYNASSVSWIDAFERLKK